LGKNRETEYFEIPARAKNSACDGARPSFLAATAMEFRICFLSGMWAWVLWFVDICCGWKKRKGAARAAPDVFL
jgi:hypothetical protein